VLREPLLYPSLYLKQRRSEYYDRLQRIRDDGDWESWLAFFAEGVRETATSAVDTTRRLVDLFRNDRERIRSLGRGRSSALAVHEALQERPAASVASIARRAGVAIPTAGSTLERLIELGVVRELTGRRRNRLFSYDGYLRILSEGTEPLPARG
jgi:Fic family protein